MKWECKIESVDNGYICSTYVPEEQDDVYVEHKHVFTESSEDEVRMFIQLVWFLAEYYLVLGNKHDKERFWCGLIGQDGKPSIGEV